MTSQEDFEDTWMRFICPAHDGMLPLRDIVAKFGLTHIRDLQTLEMIPLEEFECKNWDELHAVGFLRTSPYGGEWICYIVTNVQESEKDDIKMWHKIMAKKKEKKHEENFPQD